MATRISATDLARKLGDVIGRIRYRGESFVVEKNGTPVARIGPVPGTTPAPAGDALAAGRAAGAADPAFADALERVSAADRPPENPWGS